MLSICIPVYNCSVAQLSDDLCKQANKLNIKFEIILIDDASQTFFHKKNKLLSSKNIKYIRLNKNIGRSKIRNLFLQYVKYDYLLLLDCDSMITKNDFLTNYLSLINKNFEIACGGRLYEEKKVAQKYRLRQNYGIKRECNKAAVRKQKPYSSFMSNNFLIKKEILRKIPFNEALKNYGHEDTLFGYRLKQNKINIQHIDNPVLHNFDEDNREFIRKTEQAIENLLFISKNFAANDFLKEVKLLNAYTKLKKYRLDKVLSISFVRFLPLMRKILISLGGSLFLFDIYKLLYIIKLSDK